MNICLTEHLFCDTIKVTNGEEIPPKKRSCKYESDAKNARSNEH